VSASPRTARLGVHEFSSSADGAPCVSDDSKDESRSKISLMRPALFVAYVGTGQAPRGLTRCRSSSTSSNNATKKGATQPRSGASRTRRTSFSTSASHARSARTPALDVLTRFLRPRRLARAPPTFSGWSLCAELVGTPVLVLGRPSLLIFMVRAPTRDHCTLGDKTYLIRREQSAQLNHSRSTSR